ncbi:MAG: leucine-rich repeat domain-containing protein [Candidatus Poribacteria bacterium]|nr:leucine-rich repeat domain-containing protein [Candidatus Poribacteria bacterium]
MKINRYLPIVLLVCVGLAFTTADAQENLAQQAYLILENRCLNCHGPNGAFTENLVIDSATGLVDTGAIVPGQPLTSNLYTRLITTDTAKRMPLGQPPLDDAALQIISDWIAAGAPNWQTQHDVTFIPTAALLSEIQQHLQTLNIFDQPFARYFTMTHLYNAGETLEARNAYQIALAKLVNSLSWGFDIHNPIPIDDAETIFYIDLRNYEWDNRDAWTQIENVYPYAITFDEQTQAGLHTKLSTLQQTMNAEVPFVHVDWFLATASLPPLYHNILQLPETEPELERELGVDAERNLLRDPGRRVWRAGTNDSGVSNHNRVVERHTSRYGAYWKSHDFAGSADAQNIFTNPLDFQRDGGEVIFNLPNGLQGYYIADKSGNRIDVAPTEIVSNPAASDPAVHNGLSCIGCHTEGMKTFTDQVRTVIEQTVNPPFDKDYALLLYVTQDRMDALLAEDTARYRAALEKTGGVFGGIEPVHRFYEAFQGALEAPDAAGAVGLQTDAFLTQIREKSSLQNLGLTALTSGGSVKRDAWTQSFSDIITALQSPDTPVTTTPDTVRPILPTPTGTVRIPDPGLRAAIAEALNKAPADTITAAEMATLQELFAGDKNISDLTGLEFAKNLIELSLQDNPLSNLSPLASLTKLRVVSFQDTEVADLSPLSGLQALEVIDASATRIRSLAPLAGLKNLQKLDTVGADITDLSPLAGLTKLTRLRLYAIKATDLSPLKGLTKLKWLGLTHNDHITDFLPLSRLTELRHLDLFNTHIVDVSPLSGLVNLETLILSENRIVDVSPLASLRNLKTLELHVNNISDFSPLDPIRETIEVFTWYSNPGFPQGGPKIAGPWLWLTLPANRGEDILLTDYLAKASNSKITEQQIATFGASDGAAIGESVWSVGTLEPYKADGKWSNVKNLKRLLDAQGAIEFSDGEDFVVYGSITLYAPRTQQTKIFIGASEPRKVYLNGKLVHEDDADHNARSWAYDYQTFFPITLQPGKNVLLIKLGDEWDNDLLSLFFGLEPDTEYKIFNPSVGYSFSDSKIHVGDTFTLDLSAENVFDLAGWQFDIAFDPAMLEAIEVNEGDFLKTSGGSTFFQKGTIDNATGKISKLSSARLNEDGVTGTGTLLSVTFSTKAGGETQITLKNFQLGSVTGETINAGPHEFVFTIEGQLATGDVNRDGQVSILDLILVSRHLGEEASANPQADVNNDGIINIQDLILVAQHLGESTEAAAPAVITAINNGELTPAIIETWIEKAHLENDGSLAFRQGIATLERLLALFIPEETALLHNYPNPFNPETWIPYQLAKPAEVTLTFYAANGAVVRTFALGHQAAGMYHSRSRAAYWDGRNAVGEPVASGVYFYTLRAGDFSATRKMLIRK